MKLRSALHITALLPMLLVGVGCDLPPTPEQQREALRYQAQQQADQEAEVREAITTHQLVLVARSDARPYEVHVDVNGNTRTDTASSHLVWYAWDFKDPGSVFCSIWTMSPREYYRDGATSVEIWVNHQKVKESANNTGAQTSVTTYRFMVEPTAQPGNEGSSTHKQ